MCFTMVAGDSLSDPPASVLVVPSKKWLPGPGVMLVPYGSTTEERFTIQGSDCVPDPVTDTVVTSVMAPIAVATFAAESLYAILLLSEVDDWCGYLSEKLPDVASVQIS